MISEQLSRPGFIDEAALTAYVYIMSNMTRDVFYIHFTTDLQAKMIEFKSKEFRKKKLPIGKRRCVYLVYYKRFEHGIPVINLEGALNRMKVEEIKKFIRIDNLKWHHYNEEIILNGNP